MIPKLPKWSDPGSVASFLTAVLALLFGLLHNVIPGFQEPGSIAGLVPAVATLVAGVSVWVNVITHRKAHTSVIAAAASSPATASKVAALSNAAAALANTDAGPSSGASPAA